jgi:hypothetical protein
MKIRILVWSATLIIAAFFLSQIFPKFLGGLSRNPSATTVALLNDLRTACEGYRMEYGTWSPTFENYRLVECLLGNNPRKIQFINLTPKQFSRNKEVLDAWGTPIRITMPNQTLFLVSSGRDKIFGSKDDVFWPN